MKIPYFSSVVTTVEYMALLENDKKIFRIDRPSDGFHFVHSFATLGKDVIGHPQEKIKLIMDQCTFFQYSELNAHLSATCCDVAPKDTIPSEDNTSGPPKKIVDLSRGHKPKYTLYKSIYGSQDYFIKLIDVNDCTTKFDKYFIKLNNEYGYTIKFDSSHRERRSKTENW